MAKIKISALPEANKLAASDLLTAVSSSVSTKITVQNLSSTLTEVSSSISASYALTASYALNGGGGSGVNVQENGGTSFSSTTLNFVGAGVTAADAGGGTATITIPGGGSSTTFPYTGSAIISGSLRVIQSGSYGIALTGSLLATQSYVSSLDYIDFATNPPTPDHNEGRLHWSQDNKTLEIDTEINGFMIDVGHVNVLRGKNDNSYTLTAGTVVYIDGNSGQFATFGTASWEDDPNSAYTIGLIAQNISPSNSGYAIIQGEITGINTNAFTPGTLLYLSSSGKYTDQKPIAPLHAVRLGQVVVSGVSGKLQVKIDNGYEIDELHDVLVANSTSGDLLVRSGSLWINSKQLTGSYGLTGSLTVTGSILTTGTITAQTLVVQTVTSSIVYSSGSNIFGNEATNIQQFTGSLRVTGSGNHFIVGGNFGLNTASPSYRLDVSGSARITGSLAVGNITPSATVGRIDASNDVVAFSTSDIRYKTNIVPIPDAIDKVNQISGIHFDWIEDINVHGNSGGDIGVIAQELEAILPEVVTTRENGVKAVKYDKIVPLLIEAIKDLQRQINEFKANK
jgi:hypothetical protein